MEEQQFKQQNQMGTDYIITTMHMKVELYSFCKKATQNVCLGETSFAGVTKIIILDYTVGS